jgi:hypothetical protein
MDKCDEYDVPLAHFLYAPLRNQWPTPVEREPKFS